MTKRVLILTLIFFFCAWPICSNRADSKVYVDIDSPAFRLIPIAICDFHPASGPVGHVASETTVSERVKKDLTLTGLFNILNKQSFLENPDAVSTTAVGKIRFADWLAVGADYLVKGRIFQKDREITVEAYLYDVARGELIFGKKYQAPAEKTKAVARAIASDIMLALINDAGDFNTEIAFVSKTGLRSDIYAVSYDGADVRKVTHHQSILMAPRWSPDGNGMAFTSFKRGRPEIYFLNLKNRAEKRLASFGGLNLCGSFSPDGRKLLMTLSKDGNEEIYALDVQTLQLQRLTRHSAIDVSPSWSPDGKQIVFVSNRGGSPQIYTMDADGNNVKRITYKGSYNSSPSWSPRGDRIIYEGLTADRYQIFSVDTEGNNPAQLTSDNANNESPFWSPSGRQIVYVSRKHSGSQILIMNANGTNPRLLYEQSNRLAMPAWSGRLR